MGLVVSGTWPLSFSQGIWRIIIHLNAHSIKIHTEKKAYEKFLMQISYEYINIASCHLSISRKYSTKTYLKLDEISPCVYYLALPLYELKKDKK